MNVWLIFSRSCQSIADIPSASHSRKNSGIQPTAREDTADDSKLSEPSQLTEEQEHQQHHITCSEIPIVGEVQEPSPVADQGKGWEAESEGGEPKFKMFCFSASDNLVGYIRASFPCHFVEICHLPKI